MVHFDIEGMKAPTFPFHIVVDDARISDVARRQASFWQASLGRLGFTVRIGRSIPILGLYQLQGNGIVPIDQTTFTREGVHEREHLQAALRDHIETLDPDLLVLAEEYGQFEGVNRRIDLLCLDRSCHLVVVELKRTGDGGHMELQALRYAAMVSTLTFIDVVEIREDHLRSRKLDEASARTSVLAHLRHERDSDPIIDDDVRIVLVSEGFSKEITATVLWLNEIHQTDIRCFRLTPYSQAGGLFVNVEQIIPLPEAQDYMIRRQKREAAVRAASTRDGTKFVISSGGEDSPPLFRNVSIVEMARAVLEAGSTPERVRDVLGANNFCSVSGTLDGDELLEALMSTYPLDERAANRWFTSRPIHRLGETWVVCAMSLETSQAAEYLAKLANLDAATSVQFHAV